MHANMYVIGKQAYEPHLDFPEVGAGAVVGDGAEYLGVGIDGGGTWRAEMGGVVGVEVGDKVSIGIVEGVRDGGIRVGA